MIRKLLPKGLIYITGLLNLGLSQKKKKKIQILFGIKEIVLTFVVLRRDIRAGLNPVATLN